MSAKIIDYDYDYDCMSAKIIDYDYDYTLIFSITIMITITLIKFRDYSHDYG